MIVLKRLNFKKFKFTVHYSTFVDFPSFLSYKHLPSFDETSYIALILLLDAIWYILNIKESHALIYTH